MSPAKKSNWKNVSRSVRKMREQDIPVAYGVGGLCPCCKVSRAWAAFSSISRTVWTWRCLGCGRDHPNPRLHDEKDPRKTLLADPDFRNIIAGWRAQHVQMYGEVPTKCATCGEMFLASVGPHTKTITCTACHNQRLRDHDPNTMTQLMIDEVATGVRETIAEQLYGVPPIFVPCRCKELNCPHPVQGFCGGVCGCQACVRMPYAGPPASPLAD